jgi:hypothetical protein
MTMERVRRLNGKWEQARGEAVTLWRLERGREHLRCFIVEPPRGFWVGVERGADLIFSDTYPDLDEALMRAEGLKSPLLVAGWAEADDN